MAASFIDSTSFGGADTGFSNQGDLDAAGADFIIVTMSYFSTVLNKISDSLGNTYIEVATVGSNPTCAMYYSIPTSVGNNMTFSSDSTFSAGSAVAFSGMAQSSPLDGSATTNTSAATTIQPGSITPSANDYVWATSYSGSGFTTPPSIDSPFTAQSAERAAFGNSYASGVGWDIQTTASARNPTWTIPNTANCAIGQVFKSAGGGGGGGNPWYAYAQQRRKLRWFFNGIVFAPEPA